MSAAVEKAKAALEPDDRKAKVTKTQLVRQMGEQYLSQMTLDHVDQGTFERLMMLSFEQQPKLVRCLETPVGRTSLALSAIKSAVAGLEIGTATNEAKILPQWNGRDQCMEARLSIEYKGYMLLAERACGAQITADVVREYDTFTYGREIDRDVLSHQYAVDDRGPMIGAYAIARFSDGRQPVSVYMGETEIHKHRDESESFNGSKPEYSPWTKWPEAQWTKTVTRVLCKRRLRLTGEVASAIDADDAPLHMADGVVQPVPYDDRPKELEPPAEPEPDEGGFTEEDRLAQMGVDE